MGSSFVQYRDCGFWSRDVFIERFAGDAVHEILSLPLRQDWLTELARDWEIQSHGDFAGFIHLHLDEFLITDERRAEFKEIIRGVTNRQTAGDPIHQTGSLLLGLLDGQVKWNAASPLDYMVQYPDWPSKTDR
jgi:hypothetical protein